MSSSSEVAAGPLVHLTARAPDEGTRIDVFDGDLERIPLPENLGEVTVVLAPGVYSVTFTRGNDSLRKTVVLSDHPVTVALSEDEAPRFATPAPVRKTSSTRESHRFPAHDLSHAKAVVPSPGHAGGSHLLVFARDLNTARVGDLVAGLSLRDLDGGLVYDIAKTDQRDASACWAGAHLDLDPGGYLLRSERHGRITEQAIYTRAGWQTQVFLLSRAAGGEGDERWTDLSNVSVLMAKAGAGFDFEREDMRWAEIALSALEEHSNVPGRIRSEMLWAKFENPILGVFAALLQLRRRDIDLGEMYQIVAHLIDLVGPLPDVLAIGWALAERDPSLLKSSKIGAALADSKGLATPPMLAESWMHLMRASERQPDLIPSGSLSDRIGDLKWARGPWLAWRGEPPKFVDLGDPAALKKAANEASLVLGAEPRAAKPSMLKAFVEKLREPVSEITLGFTLPFLRTALSNNPEAGYLLVSRRYTDLERRIAFYVYPKASPAVQELTNASRAISAALSDDAPEEEKLVQSAIRALSVPASTLLRGTWSVLTKLLARPVVPLKLTAKSFATSESRGTDAFRQILNPLADERTPLRPKPGGPHASALAFLCMCYHGSQAYPAGTNHSLTALASLLNDCEYVWSDELAAVSGAQLAAHLDELREKITDAIALAVKDLKVDLPADWATNVMPPLSAYKRGALLPAPRPAPAPDQERTPGVSQPAASSSPQIASARKWIRVPHGSVLEVRVSGDQLTASAVLSGAGIDTINWTTGSSDAKRLKLIAPRTYALNIGVEFKEKGSGYLVCQIVKPDGALFGKPYKLAISGDKGERVATHIEALTVKR